MNKTTIGLWREGITDPKRLVETTIGRDHLLTEVLDRLNSRRNKESGYNKLYVGPRGIGKTHLLSLITDGVEAKQTLSNQYRVIRFPEESNRILSFADFLLGIVERLALQETSAQWSELYQQLSIDDDDNRVIDSILPRLAHWHTETGRVLLVLLENLDSLLSEHMKRDKDIHQLRSLLMDNSHIILIATAPIFFPALNDVKHPLYDFFDIEVIDELSEVELQQLIKKNLEWDGRQDLLDSFDSIVPKLQAMYNLTGGNPRLAMMLYELLINEDLIDIKKRFHQLLDRITPFYQSRVKELPPQERSLLETIALIRRGEQKTPGNIAKHFRKSREQTSALLKRMTNAGYLSISKNPDDSRSRLYRIREGFFEIWLAMNESRKERKSLPFLVDFFACWFESIQEREQQRQQLLQKIARLGGTEQQDAEDTFTYLAKAENNPVDQARTVSELAITYGKAGHVDKAAEVMQTTEINKGTMLWMRDQTLEWAESKAPQDLIERMEKIIAYWRSQRSGELERAAEIFRELRLDCSAHGLHKLHLALLEEQIEGTTSDSQKANYLNEAALIEKTAGHLTKSQKFLEQSLSIRQEIGDRSGEGTTLNNISQIYDAQGDYVKALSYLEQSLSIRQEIGDRSGEGTTLNNISIIYHAQGDYVKALSYLEQSLSISQEIGDRSGEGTTLNNISSIYHAQGDYVKALSYLEQSLSIRQEIGDRSGEGTTLNNISSIYHAQGDYVKALSYLEQSLSISQEIGNRSGEGTTLNNISQIYKVQGDYVKALSYLEQSLSISQEIGDRSGEGTRLNNISQIYDAQGDYVKALSYLEQSLSISQEIGDASGMCATFFNIGNIHHQNKEPEQAVACWLRVYGMAKKIGLAQALQALERLAEQLAMEGGLQAWQKLATQAEMDVDES